MSSLQILQHGDIEQIGEHRSPDGCLFAPVLRLKGEHTLTGLRELVNRELVQLAIGDITDGNCRALFLDPEIMHPDGSFEERQIVIAVTTNVSGRGEAYILDERSRRDYYAACFHTHSGYLTTAYGTAEGERPTTFVSNEEELLDLLRSSSPAIRSIVGETCDHLLGIEKGNERMRATSVAMALFSKFAGASCSGIQAKIAAIEDGMKRRLTSKVDRKPALGSVNIFHNVIHSAGPALPFGSNEGALFVENRKHSLPS